LELEVRRVDCRHCGTVKGERLESFLQNARHTERFARYVGERCRSGTIRDVAQELHLDWHTVKRLEKEYMREQLARAGKARPKVIGIDEISVRKGHEYRIVVSDLAKHQPIWFGGADRSETSMDEFYQFLGKSRAKKVRLAVMDMWKPFRNSTTKNAPQAAILFDKFHILRHLGEALDKVRKQEFARLSGKDRTFIKGQKYALLSHPENIKGPARKTLKLLLPPGICDLLRNWLRLLFVGSRPRHRGPIISWLNASQLRGSPLDGTAPIAFKSPHPFP
jgi:transposase